MATNFIICGKHHNATNPKSDKPCKATNVIMDKPNNATNIISDKQINWTNATKVISDNVYDVMSLMKF